MSATGVDLLHSLADRLGAEGPVEIGTMFRSPAIRTGSTIVAFLSHDGRLIVKLSRPRAEELVAEGRARPVTMGKRTMREWISLVADPADETTLDEWVPLATEALSYVRDLP